MTLILIELAELEGLPAPVQFVDTRIGADYRRGHIPGALHLDTFPYANESTDPERWPDVVADWQTVFADAGLRTDETVVFYDGGLENRAARNGFMLRYLGHPNAHVLHGGMTAWVRSGGACSRKPNVREPTALEELSLRNEMVALVADVERAVTEAGPLLLDVRDTGEFEGRVRLQWNPRTGRIPGAVPLEWTTILTFEDIDRALVGTPYYRSGMRVNLLDEEELRKTFAAVGVEEGSDVILYCQKSHRACTVYLALERLRYRSVRVYPGSFREWSRASHLPVVRTPARRA